ncbi:MAG: zinc ribbon domain-containing protein, partial [Planctomycetia bacterium]|nr:zinc ribbon domain-containing protein [Planctomycetia bacterium]
MSQKFCQSCGMPLEENSDLFGTEADGSRCEDYCVYCYKDGQFTFNGSMEEMIAICVPHIVAAHPEMPEEDARSMMQKILP